MKRLLFLVNQKGINVRLYQYLRENLKGQIEVDYGFLNGVTVSIINGRSVVRFADRDLRDYDFVFMRKTGKRYLPLACIIADYLRFHRRAFLDQILVSAGPFKDKVGSLVKLALGGIPVGDTFYNFPDPARDLKLPLIAKNVYNQRGEGVYSLNEKEDFKRLFAINQPLNYLFQPRLAIVEEYRLLILGQKVAVVQLKEKRDYSALKVTFNRQAPDVFVEPAVLSDKIKVLAVKAAAILGLTVAGVDLAVLADGKSVVIEVNRGPGLNNDPAASPEFAAITEFLQKII